CSDFSVVADGPASWLEAGFPIYLGNGVLADARFILFVHGNERLLHRRLLLGRQRDDLGLAGCLDRGEGVGVLFLRDVVGELGGVLHRAVQRGADVGGQAIPEFLVRNDRVAKIAVVGQRKVLLHFLHLL